MIGTSDMIKTWWNTLLGVLASAGAFLGWFLGEADGFMYTLVTLVVIDYVSGVLCAVIEKKLSSAVGLRGIFKKAMVFIMVGVGHVIDTQLIGEGGAMRTALIFFFVSNEGISLLENAARLGLPVPDKIKNVLALLHEKGRK